MTNIAEKLKNLRIKHGLSQEKLAEQLMVSRQAVSKWEKGEALPDVENMIALAKLYNISLDELVGLSTDNQKNQNTPENSINADENTTLETVKKDEDKNAKNGNGKNNNTAKRQTISIFRSVPYPIVVSVIFLLIGSITHEWHVAWILFVTIPIYYTTLDCIDQKRISPFAYPVFVTCIFLFLGMQFSIWHPSWVIFITIPIFYAISHEIDKKLAKQRKDN